VRSPTHEFKTESKEYRKETGTPLAAHTAKRARMKRVAPALAPPRSGSSSWSEPFAYSKKDTRREEWLTHYNRYTDPRVRVYDVTY
jgi:hypothetical protein